MSRARSVVRNVVVLALVGLAAAAGCGRTPSPTPDATVLADHLEVPWGLGFLPTGDALVGERETGKVFRIPAEGGAPVHVATLPDVDAEGEGGLLGLAVSPLFIHDSFVYAYLTSATDNRIVRFRLIPDDTDPADLQVLLDGIRRAGNHNGGGLAFGPDGMLYAGTGDAGVPEDAQDLDSLNGKILRMTPVGVPAPDNPIPGSYVYSRGHRNVQGLAWDSRKRLWATEFGQDEFDEVNLIRPAHDYGWPEVEGIGDTRGGRYTNPEVTWSPSEASPSGAAVVPDPDGDTLFVAALRGERLWRIPVLDQGLGTPESLLEGEFGRLRTVALASDGSLWVTTSNRDGRGDPADEDDRVLRYLP